MTGRIIPLDAIFDSHVPNDVVERIAPYVLSRPQHPLVLLRDEARRLSRDARLFAESVDGWMGSQFAVTEEKHRYAGDET